MYDMPLEKYKESHRLLTSLDYETKPVVHGYADRTLHIDLSKKEIGIKPVTQQMKDIFTGGRGFCLWLLWNAVNSKTCWDSPENELVIAGGPIGGITQYPGSGKSTVVTISPLTGVANDSNGGGYFGPYLKYSGFDALEIQGKAEKDVIIFIDGDNGRVAVEEAPLEMLDTHRINVLLTEMYAKDEKSLRGVSVISAGRAADYAAISGLNISFFDQRRKEVRIKQAARGGSGRVFRDKKIKAIVVRFSDMKGNINGVADPELVSKAGKRINKEIVELDPVQNDMAHLGTTNLVEVMNYHDLLPVQNFRYGKSDQAVKISADYWRTVFDYSAPDSCWYGCSMACSHMVANYKVKTGPYKGNLVSVDGPEYETLGGVGSNLDIFDPEVVAEINFYADTYGLDTISLGNSIAFAMECYEKGILNKENTGGLELTWGNADVALEIIHQMGRGEGFGLIVGQGIRAMKNHFVENFGADPDYLNDIGMEIKGLEISEYMAKESLAQQGGYALATKGPQHDEAWLIFMDMVLNQIPTFEDKAEALHYFPMWRTWFSLHGLCKLPWNDVVPVDNKLEKEPAKVPEHVKNYTWLYEGVLGNPITIDEIILQSEKVYNFQRIFSLRMGYGKRKSDYPPYRAMGPVTVEEYKSREERYDKSLREDVGINPDVMGVEEKVAALRKYRYERYEKLVDAVYLRRGWNSDGVPKLETVKRLGIDFPEVLEIIRQNGG